MDVIKTRESVSNSIRLILTFIQGFSQTHGVKPDTKPNEMLQNEMDNETGRNHAGKRANSPLRLLTASSMRGDKVFNPEGEELGKIMDFMINLDDGKIQYVIIKFGGFLGIAEKFFAIPFEDLAVDIKREAFILDQRKASFENNPGFDKDHWPESNSHNDRTRYASGFMGANTGSDH